MADGDDGGEGETDWESQSTAAKVRDVVVLVGGTAFMLLPRSTRRPVGFLLLLAAGAVVLGPLLFVGVAGGVQFLRAFELLDRTWVKLVVVTVWFLFPWVVIGLVYERYRRSELSLLE